MSIRDMVDSIMADEEEESDQNLNGGGDDLGGGGGGLMAEEGGEMDGGGGGGEDLGGLGDLDDGGDDLGGLDDGFDDVDGGDEMAGGGGGGNVDELEHRLDELENEVGSLSSTVNTVRNENEQISNSVEEVEENVRKLLDIYEMVTRGVNPFADEMDGGMGMGGGGQMDAQDGSFGLFTDEEGQEEESVDGDIADADAEGFFDDDLVEEDDDDVGGIDGGLEDTSSESNDDSGGTSFEDLKDEYESGEAEWDEEGDEDDGGFEEVGDGFDDNGFEEVGESDAAVERTEGFEDADDGLADDDLSNETVEETPAQEAAVEQATESVEQAATDSQPTTTETVETTTQPTQTTESPSTSDGKPYIATLPEGFAADLIVVEWLEFLVSEAGIREASKALNYYESVGWISEDVAAEMDEYLRGFTETGRGSLVIDHHKQSLEYITQLNGNVSGTGLDAIGGQKR